MSAAAQKCLDEVSEALASGDQVVVVIIREDEPVDQFRYDVRWSEDCTMFDLLHAGPAVEEAANDAEPGE